MTGQRAAKSPQKRARRGVRAAYTWANVKNDVQYRLRSKSLREVADDLGLKNHSIVQRIRDGIEPHDPSTREILRLPKLGLAARCTKCGECHVTKRCTKKPARAQVSLYWNKDKPLTLGVMAFDYWEWLTSNAAELARRVRWAEVKNAR